MANFSMIPQSAYLYKKERKKKEFSFSFLSETRETLKCEIK